MANLVVLDRPSHVERLVVDDLAGRVQYRQERARDVLDVDQRPPGRAVAGDQHLAGGVGERDQVVDDEVAAQPGRHAVRRGVAQERRAERRVRERRHVLLDQDLGGAVRRDRIERRVLGQEPVAGGDAVQAAGG